MTESSRTDKKGFFATLISVLIRFFIFMFLVVVITAIAVPTCSDRKVATDSPVITTKIKTPLKRTVITERELTEKEFADIKKEITPVIDKYSIILDDAADDYADRVKNAVLAKKVRSGEFGEEIFSIGNVPKFLKYRVFSENGKANSLIEEIWNGKMFTNEELQSEIEDITEEFRLFAQGQINLMESEIKVEIDELAGKMTVPNIKVKNSSMISDHIKATISNSASDIVKDAVLKITAFEIADFVLTDVLVKLVVAKTLVITGVSAASMTVKVVTMGIGIAAGVAINAYLQNNAIKELSDKTGSEIDVLAAEIVDKNEGIRSSMKQVSKEIISTYNSLETERIVRKNIKVTEHKVY